MRIGKRIAIGLLLVLLLAPVATVTFLLYSRTGLDMVVRQLPRLERYGLHFAGVSGTLAGTLRVDRFELDHPRVHIVSHDIVVKPQLRGLLLQTIQAGSLSARDTVVELRDDPRPPSDAPLRFLPAFMRIKVNNASFDRVRYVHTNGVEFSADSLQGEGVLTSRRIRVPQFKVNGDLFDAVGDLQLKARRPMDIELHADGHLRPPNTPQLTLQAQLGGDIDTMTIKAQVSQPDIANADVILTHPEQRWQIKGKVDSPAVSLEPWLQNSPLSLHKIALNVLAGPDEVHIDGSVVVPEFDDNDLLVDARGFYADRTLHIADSDISFRDIPGHLSTRGTVLFDGGPATLDLTGNWSNLQWPLRETAVVRSSSGDAALRGPLPYTFQTTAIVDGPGFPQVSGAASGVLTKESMTIGSYAVSAFDGSFAGKATLDFDQPRAWALSTQARAVNPATLWRDFPGKLDFAADSKGVGLDKAARFSVAIRGLHGIVREQAVSGSGAVTRESKGWKVADADVRYGDAHLNLDGELRDTIDAHWSLSAPTLSRLFPLSHGALYFTGSATGPLKTPHVVAKLDGSQLRYREWSAASIALDGDVDAAGRQPSRLTASATRVGRGAPVLETLHIVGNGTPTEHRINIDATGMKPNAHQASQRASMVVTANFQQQVWNATIASTQISTSDAAQAVAMAEPAKLMISADRATLDNMCLVIAAGRLCANGKWESNGPWEATLAGYEIPLAIVLPPSGEEAEYAGRIEGRIHASGLPGKPWQGEAGMRIVDAAIVYTPKGAEPETLQLGTGGLAATATTEKVEFSFGVQAFTDTFLYANAHLQREGSNDLLHVPFTGDMRGRAGDANILPLLFPDIDHAAGVITGNANFTGSLAMPEVNGRIELSNGEFDSYRVNLALRNIGLAADVASNSLSFSGRGNAGDGQLDIDGRFRWHEGESSGVLNLRGSNLLIADLPEYRVVASPDLKFTIEGNKLDAAGAVTIPSALVQPAKLTGAVRASADARYTDETAEERDGRLVVHGDIKIKMGDDVRVDAFGLQGRILGAVNTVTQTGNDPIGRGELSVSDGRYEAYGQKLGINRGRLLFEASPLDDPGLDIEARREIDAVTVGLNVRGTLQEPRITFFSDPSMPQTQIVSYLLVGKSMDTVASNDTSTINSARSSMAMQGGGLIASQLGRRIGIEEVGVESSVDTSGQTNTALVLGKFLSPRLFISYGISLTESINTLKLRYTLSDKWILKTEAGEFQSADVEYSIER